MKFLVWLERRGWVYLLAFSVLVLGLGLYQRRTSDASQPHWDIPYEAGQTIDGSWPDHLLDSPTKLNLIAFFPRAQVTNRVAYLASLDRVHRQNGLRVIGVAASCSLRDWYKAAVKLPFNIICDEDMVVHGLFRTAPQHDHGSMALVDGRLRIIFHGFYLPESDEIRRLVEGALFGRPDLSYQSARREALAVGRPFPSLPFVTVEGESIDRPRTHGKVFLFIPPDCGACQINTLSGSIRRLTQAGGIWMGSKPTVIVFPHSTLTVEWDALFSSMRQYVSEAWLTKEPGFFWDPYFTRYVSSDGDPVNDPIVVITDARGNVERFSRLRELSNLR